MTSMAPSTFSSYCFGEDDSVHPGIFSSVKNAATNISAAGITTDITSTTGIELIGPAQFFFSGFCRPNAGPTGIAQDQQTPVRDQ